MTNRVITFFEKIGSAFKKIFGSKATWEQTAIATIKYVGPLLETIISLAGGPALGAEVTNIINEIKADLSTLYTVAQDGAVAAGSTASQTAQSVLTSINTNMALLLQDAGIKNSTKAADIEATANLITGEATALLSNLPNSTPSAS